VVAIRWSAAALGRSDGLPGRFGPASVSAQAPARNLRRKALGVLAAKILVAAVSEV
jgi:hypothetical protein